MPKTPVQYPDFSRLVKRKVCFWSAKGFSCGRVSKVYTSKRTGLIAVTVKTRVFDNGKWTYKGGTKRRVPAKALRLLNQPTGVIVGSSVVPLDDYLSRPPRRPRASPKDST